MAPPSSRVESDPSLSGMRRHALQDLPQVTVENLEEGMLKLGNFPVASQLHYFYGAWSSLTKDLWVL